MEDEIEEKIEQNRPSAMSKNDNDNLNNSQDNAAASGGVSSSGANAIDHSIDTLHLEQYDYVEEVKFN